MTDLVTGGDQDRQAKQNEQWSFTVSRDSLKKEPALATLMLRLGAAANAIRATQGWSLACKEASGGAGQRDLIWSFLVAAAYLKEAIDSLLGPHYEKIVQLAREDGTPEDAIKSLGDLMSKKRQDLYTRVLVNARNRLVFHWEEETFRHWAEHHNEPRVVWAQGTGEKDDQVVFAASSRALLDSLIPGASEAEIHSRINEVLEASGLLVGVFQRTIHAYLSAYDE